ncbi:MAG: helix-turn-helix transcriptional regulator [Chloroflexaceae bacterium]|nr:helix-turn-helix transcriptional regulator [Chloroflexaceae bacterium]
MQRFPEKLVTLRERRGMSQRKLADALGFHHTYINRLEKGERKPNAAFLLKVSQLFRISADVLLNDDLELTG